MSSPDTTQMNPELSDLRQTVRNLYEGPGDDSGIPLAAECAFHDPLVVVYGEKNVLAMFRKLNRMYPATSVASFAPLENSPGKYALSVHYRRRGAAKATVFQTEIEFLFAGEEIVQITEDWIRPVPLSGRGTHRVNRWLRESLGRIFS